MATFEVANEQLAAIQDFLDVQRRLGMAPSLYDEIENQQACTLARVIARLKSLKAVDDQTLSATLARGNWGAIAKDQLAKCVQRDIDAFCDRCLHAIAPREASKLFEVDAVLPHVERSLGSSWRSAPMPCRNGWLGCGRSTGRR